jgi:type IV secretory pathway VirB3-like protein
MGTFVNLVLDVFNFIVMVIGFAIVLGVVCQLILLLFYTLKDLTYKQKQKMLRSKKRLTSYLRGRK